MLDQGVDMIVPIIQHSDFRQHFVYDVTRPCYQCPEGHTLRYAGKNTRNKSDIYAITDATRCTQCPRFGQGTTSVKGRRIERPWTEAVRERLAHRYQQSDVPRLTRRRKCRAEVPFGHIKHNLGMRMFLLRGLQGVGAEFALAATAFNIRRLVTLVGAPELLQQLSLAPA